MAYESFRRTDNGDVPVGNNLFGTCGTAYSTAAKVVSMPAFNVLIEGVTIHVRFTYGNYGAATLKVGSTAAKSIRRNGSTTAIWEAGATISFTYYGGYWEQNDFYNTDTDTDTNTTYSLSGSGRTITLTSSTGVVTQHTVPESASEHVMVDSQICYPGSISAGGYLDNFYTEVYPTSGYKPIGVVGWNMSNADSGGANASNCVMIGCYISNGYIYMKIKNTAGSAAKVQVRVFILWRSE